MRNFKKFLALVLAMLMVSACAVSVSAFDDVDEDTKYVEAIEMLADLGVIAGRGDGKFYPNDTLTREEAAKIAAVTLVGAQPIEWNVATTRFTDVTSKWSFGYINYCDDEGVIYGKGGDIFDPKADLRIDEALKIAVAMADPAAARKADLGYKKDPSLGWAAYYIEQADLLGLTADVTIRKYDIPCTRGMFAQFIYNAFDFVEDPTNEEPGDKFGLQENFGYDYVEGFVDYDADNALVTVDGQDIAAALFNEALKDAGYTETAADLEAQNCKVYMSWMKSGKNIVILSMEVLTTCEVVLYNDKDIKIENAYADLDSDGAADDLDKKYLVINGVKYEAGKTDDDGTAGDVLGGVATPTVGITLTVDGDTVGIGEVDTLPKYFKAFVYDDDDDGDFERCDITTYAIAYISKTAASAADKADLYTVTYFGQETGIVVNKDDKTAAKWSIALADVPADGDTPVLVQAGITPEDVVAGITVDVIEVGAPVSGKVTAISASGKYVLIDGKKYEYENNNVVVDSETRNQTITAYLINGKLVNVSEASFSTFEFIVDSAAINEAGNVVLTGFYASDFKADTIELVGAYDSDTEKFIKYTGHYVDKTADTDTEKYVKYAVLGGTKNSDGSWKDDYIVKFEDGVFYQVIKTADGLYYEEYEDVTVVKNLGNFFNEPLAEDEKFAVAADYVYVGGVPQYHNNNTVVIVKKADADLSKNAYYETYTFTTTFAEALSVVASTNAITEKKVAYVYVTDAGEAEVVTSEIKKLAEGQSIVQILDAYVEASYDYFTYNAFDIIKGEKVVVKATVGNLDKGEFYLVNGDEVVDDPAAASDGISPTEWVRFRYVFVTTSGVVKKYSAKPTYFKKTGDAAPVYATVSGDESVEYGAVQIKVYKADAENAGVISFTDGVADTYTLAEAFVAERNDFENAYIVADQIIIIK